MLTGTFHIIVDFLLFQCYNEYFDAVSICRVLLHVAGFPVGEFITTADSWYCVSVGRAVCEFVDSWSCLSLWLCLCVARELSSSFTRLCHYVDLTKSDLQQELNELRAVIAHLDEAATHAKSLK